MRYVIIGGSAAAISAVETIRSIDRDSPIDLFSDEPIPSSPGFSCRTTLPRTFETPLNSGRRNSSNRTRSRPISASESGQITVDSKFVHTERGDQYPFDKLLMATGGNPIVPPSKGSIKRESRPENHGGCGEDLSSQREKSRGIGAGSVGVESCIAERKGIEVT